MKSIQKKQGITEIIILVALLVIAVILITAVFGSNQKGLFQASNSSFKDGRTFSEMSEEEGFDDTKEGGRHSTKDLAGNTSKKSDGGKPGGKAQSKNFVPPGPESKKYTQAVQGKDPRHARTSTGAPKESSGGFSGGSASSGGTGGTGGSSTSSGNSGSTGSSSSSGGSGSSSSGNASSGGFSGGSANTNPNTSGGTQGNTGNSNSRSTQGNNNATQSGGFNGNTKTDGGSTNSGNNSGNNSNSGAGGFSGENGNNNSSKNQTSNTGGSNEGGKNSASGGFSGNESSTGGNGNATTENKSSSSGGFQGTDANTTKQDNASTTKNANNSGGSATSEGEGGSSQSQNNASGNKNDPERTGGKSDNPIKSIEPDMNDQEGWDEFTSEDDPLYWKRLRDVRSLEHAYAYTHTSSPNNNEVQEKLEILIDAYNNPKFFPSRARYERWLKRGGKETKEFKEQNTWYYLRMQEIMAGYEVRKSF